MEGGGGYLGLLFEKGCSTKALLHEDSFINIEDLKNKELKGKFTEISDEMAEEKVIEWELISFGLKERRRRSFIWKSPITSGVRKFFDLPLKG